MKILFFSPNSAITLFAHPEAVLARSLREAGHNVTYVTCGRLYDTFCTSMMAHNQRFDSSAAEKSKICALCCGNAKHIRRSFNLEGYDLADQVSGIDTVQVENLIHKSNKTAILDYTLDRVNLGRIALYEFLINHKKNTINFTDEEWKEYTTLFRNTAITYITARKIFQEEKPDSLIMYNSLYVVNHAFRAAAEKAEIPVYQIHATENLAFRSARIFITRHNTYFFRKQLKEAWLKYSHLPRGREVLSEVTAHLGELFSAKSVHVYSSAKGRDVSGKLDKYGFSESQKLVVATLSSYDERFAGEECGALERITDSIFKSQIEWVKDLIAFFNRNPDLFLLIRVHPREFPNRREKVKSEHATQLAQEFTKLPKNVRINWPEDGISLYDLAEHTDLFLNAWSSAGEEMTLFGIPVLLFSSKFVMYASEINHVESDKGQYFRKIRELAFQQEDIRYVTNAFRWYAMKMHDTSFSILRPRKFAFFWKTISYIRVFTLRVRNKFFSPRFVDLHLLKMIQTNRKSVSVQNVIRLMETRGNTLIDVNTREEDPNPQTEHEFISEYYRRRLAETLKSRGSGKRFRDRLGYLLSN